jgi:Bacterial regulatory proteins, luxR family
MALLTPRERDVVRLMAKDMRNQEISAKLKLREHTLTKSSFSAFRFSFVKTIARLSLCVRYLLPRFVVCPEPLRYYLQRRIGLHERVLDGGVCVVAGAARIAVRRSFRSLIRVRRLTGANKRKARCGESQARSLPS